MVYEEPRASGGRFFLHFFYMVQERAVVGHRDKQLSVRDGSFQRSWNVDPTLDQVIDDSFVHSTSAIMSVLAVVQKV